MKKTSLIAIMMIAAFTFSSCGTGSSLGNSSSTASTAGAAIGSALGSALGGSTGSSIGQAGGSVLGSLLSTLLSGATTNKQTIVGTWTYQGPEVRFESENILAQVGGTAMSSKISSALGTQLQKWGLKEGKSTFTFNSDGTMTATLGSKKTNGKYTYNSANQTITMTGALGLTNMTATVAVTGNTMYLLFDSSKLLSFVTSGSGTSTFGSLLGNYSGMKMGWSMKK